MSSDFEKAGHKSIELLRFYINRDINSLKIQLNDDNVGILSYILASFIDLAMVIKLKDYFELLDFYDIFFSLIILMIIFALLNIFFKCCLSYYNRYYSESGRILYDYSNITRQIDEFDNIACDGLLICEYYKKKYTETPNSNLRKFYFYEILHYMLKINEKFLVISLHPELYIYGFGKNKSRNIKLIKGYRVNNFIEILSNINNFLKEEADLFPDNQVMADLKQIDYDVKNFIKRNKNLQNNLST